MVELVYLRSRGDQRQQRTSPGRQARYFEANTPEEVNTAILSPQGHRNVWDQSY